MGGLMDAAHLHLVLNHLPMLGVVFAGALFAIARWQGSAPFQRVSLGVLVFFALAAIPVYLTGEPAEDAVERIAGVSEQLIERHEDAAVVAFTAMEVLGALALLGVVLFARARAIPRVLAAGVLALTVVTSGLMGWTGYLGGMIRHTEIRSASMPGSVPSEAKIRSRHHDD